MYTTSIAQDVQFVETQASVNWHAPVAYMAADLFLPPTAAEREFRSGWELFVAGGFLIDCVNNDQRRGWQAARRMAQLADAAPAMDATAAAGQDDAGFGLCGVVNGEYVWS